MQDFQQHNELNKTLNRFNKIRLYHNSGYRNLLPIEVFKNNSHKYQQLQLNTQCHFNAIIMDIDNEDLLTEWNHQGLPTPTIQTVNQENNKAHLIWLLNTPVWKEHKHVVSYYKAIVNSIKKLIGADVAYQNHETKNFLNTKLYRVTYIDVAYNLEDFRDFITPQVKENNNDGEYDYLVSGSRHIHLFEELRRYGYKIANETDLKYQLNKRAEYINECFNEPIKVKYIVNSVYQFCEKNKNNFKNISRSRIMFKKIKNLTDEEFKKEVKVRQNKSAQRTTTIKKLKMAAKIKIAIDALLRQKKQISPKNISMQAKISLSTARRNIKIIKIFTQKTSGFIRSIRLIVQRAKRIRTTANLEHYNLIYNQISINEFICNLSPPS